EEETFVLLRDGSVLASAVRDTPKAQRYVPLLDEWLHVDDAPVPLAIDTLSGVGVFETGPAILLPNGKVFVIGGTRQTAIFAPGPHLNSPRVLDHRPGISQRYQKRPELAYAHRARRPGMPAAQRQGRLSRRHHGTGC